MTKYGHPIVTVRQADCDSRTPIFSSPSFLGETGCDVLQVVSVGPVISPYPLPAMIGDQCGIVFFKCHTVWKWGEASHDQSGTTEQMVAFTFLEIVWEHSVKVKWFSFSFLFLGVYFFHLWGSFVLCAWCFCYHCVFVIVVSLGKDSFILRDCFSQYYFIVYSWANMYLDIDIIFIFLALYTTTMNLKWNNQGVL